MRFFSLIFSHPNRRFSRWKIFATYVDIYCNFLIPKYPCIGTLRRKMFHMNIQSRPINRYENDDFPNKLTNGDLNHGQTKGDLNKKLYPYKRTCDISVSPVHQKIFWRPSSFSPMLFLKKLSPVLKKHQKIVARPVLLQNWLPVQFFARPFIRGGGVLSNNTDSLNFIHFRLKVKTVREPNDRTFKNQFSTAFQICIPCFSTTIP